MSRKTITFIIAFLSTVLIPMGTEPAMSEGVPLPGITLYGRITDMAGTTRLTSGLLQVRIAPQGGGEARTLVTPLMNLGGEFSYVLRVPVELTVAGETLSNNAVMLPQSSVTYTISADVGGVAATLQGGTTNFTFSPDQHRGSVQRIDMQATGIVELAEDANGDGTVSREDILYWFEYWMEVAPEKFDFSGNGRIDGPDLVHLLDSIRDAGQ